METNWSERLQKAGSLGIVILGNILYALAVKLFLMPAGLLTGGTTGIGLALNRAFGIPVSSFVLSFNVIMLLIGWKVMGRKFALTTIVSTFVYPIALGFFEKLFGNLVLTQDLFLCTIFSGLGIGSSLGIVIRAGASTGGMDIPPLVLNHYLRIPVSISMYVFDFCILLVQAVGNPPEKVMYGLILVMTYTLVLDKLMLMGTTRTEVRIVSKHAQKIREAIISEMDRGVTMLSGETGYLKHQTQMIFSVISNRELPRLEKLIHAIDPESFMVVNRVSEVSGRGFSMKKRYR
ncbi:YitT family protein [Ventrimonas sp. CLA-AP-H27]|uniref:YitT family protein n=1 Tax=Ventrimonas faecis TaxID=3133170 RepID=A0ABV1HM49_9FIRM